MEKENYFTFSPEETETLGRQLMSRLEYPEFIALYGDLGVGKTAFVKGLISSVLPDAVVTSPTYNIVNKYTFGNKNIFHFDMYRITDDDDLYSVGFYDYLDDGIVISEWSENIPDAIPERYIKVTIEKLDHESDKRKITMEFFK